MQRALDRRGVEQGMVAALKLDMDERVKISVAGTLFETTKVRAYPESLALGRASKFVLGGPFAAAAPMHCRLSACHIVSRCACKAHALRCR